jgi:hypothetical protein
MREPDPNKNMWTSFFSAAAGASATLAGLVIVAVSVNINRILQHPQLPVRAGAAVATLILILLSSMATLIPQPPRLLGIELATFGSFCWMLEVYSSQNPSRLAFKPIDRGTNPCCKSYSASFRRYHSSLVEHG